MANNLEYLERELAECIASQIRIRGLRDGWDAEKGKLSEQLRAKQLQLTTIQPWKKNERNAVSAQIAAISVKMQEAANKVNLYQDQLNTQIGICNKLQDQIDAYVDARTEAAANGMGEREQDEYADRETEEFIAEWEASKQVEEQADQADKNKKTLYLIGGLLLLAVVAGLIIWAIRRARKKAK